MPNRERRAFTLVEILIVVAILAVLVGVAVPFLQDEIRAARSARTAKNMDQARKLLGQAAVGRGLTAPFLVEAPASVPKLQRPEFEEPLETLVPRHLQELPKDSWDMPVYRFGNFLVSNGADSTAGTEDDVSIKVQELATEVDPDTGAELRPRELVEAEYQATAIALRLQRLVAGGAPAPADLAGLWVVENRASPPDPWGQPYVMLGDAVGSAGPDFTVGTGDDVVVPWRNQARFADGFEKGIWGWSKVFPTGDSPPTWPIRWDEASKQMVFPPQDDGQLRQAYWARPLPATFDPGPWVTTSVKVHVERSAGTAVVGLVSHFAGAGSGYRGQVQLDATDGVARIQLGAPGMNGPWLAPAKPPMPFLNPANPPSTLDLTLTLRTEPGPPPRIRFLVSGGQSGSLEGVLPGPPGRPLAVAVYLQAINPGARFWASFDDLEVEPN